MIVPFITLLKIVALGSIKLIFLLLGTVFFPIFALRLILGGATGMLLPILAWLEQNDRLDAMRHKAIVEDLEELAHIDISRKEAQYLLWQLVKKMMSNLKESIVGSINWTIRLFSKLFR